MYNASVHVLITTIVILVYNNIVINKSDLNYSIHTVVVDL